MGHADVCIHWMSYYVILWMLGSLLYLLFIIIVMLFNSARTGTWWTIGCKTVGNIIACDLLLLLTFAKRTTLTKTRLLESLYCFLVFILQRHWQRQDCKSHCTVSLFLFCNGIDKDKTAKVIVLFPCSYSAHVVIICLL